MSKLQTSETVHLKPVAQSLEREDFKPKVQAFLYSHKNDAHLVNPQKNFTRTLLDRMFVARPKKVLPQLKKKENRLQFYKNVKEDEVITADEHRKISADEHRKISADEHRKISADKISHNPSVVAASTGLSSGASPAQSPKIRPMGGRGSIFETTFKTKFSQDFLHSMISVQQQPRKKTGHRKSKNQWQDEEEYRITEQPNEDPFNSNGIPQKNSSLKKMHSTAEKVSEKTDLGDSERKRTYTAISPSKKRESDELDLEALKKRSTVAGIPDKKAESNGLTPEALKKGTSIETGSITNNKSVVNEQPKAETLKRGNSTETSPSKKVELNELAGTDSMRKRNVTVVSPSKKPEANDLTADVMRKRTTTVTGPSQKQ